MSVADYLTSFALRADLVSGMAPGDRLSLRNPPRLSIAFVLDERKIANSLTDNGMRATWPKVAFSDKCLMQLSVNGVYSSSGSVVLSGEFGTTASDLCQHVDQHFEIGGLYTFKQSMSLFVNWTLDDREQLLA